VNKGSALFKMWTSATSNSDDDCPFVQA
jgi:hypothetical protein